LDDDTLQFASREAFNREIGQAARDPITAEDALLSKLSTDRLGLVLAGPGGVGKTRLAVQLGGEAEKQDWLVLQVERDARREAIEQLAREYVSSARVLLIIDYAEAARSLFELVQEMERANRDGQHAFRFIATCRESALSAVKEALEGKTLEILPFSDRPDDRYATWVVRKILDHVELPDSDSIAQVCAGLPVLAAFAVFLFKEHRDKFDAQFGRIHRGDDFEQWADKRIKFALNARGLDDQATRARLPGGSAADAGR